MINGHPTDAFQLESPEGGEVDQGFAEPRAKDLFTWGW